MADDPLHQEIQRLLAECVQHHREGRHRLSLRCYQKVMALASPTNDAAFMAFLLAQIGGEYRDCDEYQHAATLLVTALSIVPKEEHTLQLQASIKKVLAITFKDIFGAQKPEVMQLLEESRADYHRNGDLGQEANVLQHIGGCLIQLGRLKEAEHILTEALNKARAEDDVQLEGWIYDDLADLEIERNDWGMALEYTRKAREKAQAVKDSEAEGDTWLNEARVQMRMGFPEEALIQANRALETYTEAKNLRRTIRARRHVAKALIRLSKINDAQEILSTALRTATQLDLWRDQCMLFLDLGNIELQRKNYGLVRDYAVRARSIAEAEGMQDLVDAADELLRSS